jgi:NAD(P)-dependent dehydrogenase (short-subunit alcohol dehydrogenase family)
MSTDPKIVLVTGAGRGLGRAISNRYREAGFTVVATDFDASLLADLEGVEGFVTAQQDVTDIDRAAEIATLIRERCGRLDVIVNNAGVNVFLPISEAPPQKTIQHFMVNTFAAVIVPQACLDLLIESKGRIVNISSESSTFRAPFQTYQSSKMALECISDVMRRELMFHDVHVTFIRPGAIRTDLLAGTADLHMDAPADSRYASLFPKFKEMVAKNTPTNVSEPSEVAELVFTAGTDNKKKHMYTINNKFLYKVIAKLPALLVDKGIKKDLT